MYKRFFQDKKAIFFDLDGTLIDNAHLWKMAHKRVLEKVLGYEPEKFDMYYETGRSGLYQWKVLTDFFDVSKSGKNIQQLSSEAFSEYLKIVAETNDFKVRDGFFEFMFDIKNHNMQIALVTGVERDIATFVLGKLEILDVFDLIVCGDDVKRPKPDPEIFLTAAKMLKLTPQKILVFEDSITGTSAAIRAGMDLIVVWDGVTPKYKFPDKTLDFTFDFTPYVRNMDTDAFDLIKEKYEAEQKKQTGINPGTGTPPDQTS